MLANTFRRSQTSRVVTRAPRETLGGLLLDISGPIDLPSAGRFVAHEGFTFGTGDNVGDKLPLSSPSENFVSVFFDLVEEDVRPVAVTLRRLLQCSAEEPILSVLGGRDRAKIALVHMKMFLKERADKTDAFLFYVADKRGVIWSVDAGYNFSRQAWNIDAVRTKSVVMLDVHRILSPAEL